MTLKQLATALVKITKLGAAEGEYWGRISSLTGTRVHLNVDEPLPPGTSVRIDGPDFLLLGEIVYCEPEGNEYTAYCDLEHASADAEVERFRAMVSQPR